MKKVAIIASGGGMHCAFSAGCFRALQQELGFDEPALIVAASGSAGGAFYYLAGQTECLKRIWTVHIASFKFIAWRRLRKIMDIDYLVDTVLAQLETFDENSFRTSKITVYVPLLKSGTKDLEYIDNKKNFPPLEILRAAKAVPVIYGNKVQLGTDYYTDGATKASLNNMIEFASELGATHFLILDNQIENKVYKILKKIFYSNSDRLPAAKLKSEHLVVIKCHSPISTALTTDSATLISLFEEGYQAIKNYPGLRKFLKN